MVVENIIHVKTKVNGETKSIVFINITSIVETKDIPNIRI